MADSCKDRFILSFISAQELDCFDNSGLKVFTFWRIAGHMLHVLATPFQYNLWCSALLGQHPALRAPQDYTAQRLGMDKKQGGS